MVTTDSIESRRPVVMTFPAAATVAIEIGEGGGAKITIQEPPPKKEGGFGLEDFAGMLAESSPRKTPSEIIPVINGPLFDILPEDEKVSILLEAILLLCRRGMTEGQAVEARKLLINAAMRIGLPELQ